MGITEGVTWDGWGPQQEARLEIFISKAAGWFKTPKPAKVSRENTVDSFPSTVAGAVGC